MNITVYKYDPATDSAPYPVSGEVPYKDKMTALEAILYFHENIQSINFDYNCACRLCGRCAMMLDGESRLVCVTPISDTDHIFEPLHGYPIIRDLIVDKEALDRQIGSISPRVRLEPFNEDTITPVDYDPSTKDAIYAMEFCCRCGVCNAACPVLETSPGKYEGPAALTAIAYRHMDPLDQGDRIRDAVGSGMYHCIMCGKCDEVCSQKDIHHVENWTMLRAAAESQGLKPSYA